MKTIVQITLFLIVFFIIRPIAFGQSDLWPIKNINTGEGIMYRPQDYIGDELNFGNLYISGINEEDTVVAPCSGTVKRFAYTYYSTMKNARFFKYEFDKEEFTVEEFDLGFRNAVAEHYEIDSKFVGVEITIENNKGESFVINGIRPFRYFVSGEKITKGDIIGKIGYSYVHIDKPSITLSKTKSNIIIDPMKSFGLKSTFNLTTISKEELETKKHSVSQLIVDFKVFEAALKEGHVGLYDYISKKEMDLIFKNKLDAIKSPMTSAEFRLFLAPIVKAVKDGHTAIVLRNGSEKPKPPLLFGLVNNELIVFATAINHEKYLNKKIVALDDVNVDQIIEPVRQIIYGSDGEIKTFEQRKLQLEFWKYYIQLFAKKKGDKLNITFSDGVIIEVICNDFSLNDYRPAMKPADTEKFTLKRLSSTLAIVDINTFQLLDADIDSIGRFIKSISDSSFSDLIFDVRDNFGGTPEAIYQLFSFVSNKPFYPMQAQKVNKNGEYYFFKNCLNYSSQEKNLFANYIPIESESGFFLPKENLKEHKPNPKFHFSEQVYVLINEYSLSAATLFPGLIRTNDRGIIVGRETGSSYNQLNATKSAQVYLENTGLILYVPLIKTIYNTKPEIQSGRGVLPDEIVPLKQSEFLNDNDPILNATLDLIEKKSR